MCVVFYCCRCLRLSSFELLYILLGWLTYGNASWSIRSSYICSVAVLWEPRISKKFQLRKNCLFSSLWQCIFQLIQRVLNSLFSLRSGRNFSTHNRTLNPSVLSETFNFKISQIWKYLVFIEREGFEELYSEKYLKLSERCSGVEVWNCIKCKHSSKVQVPWIYI